MRRPFRNGVRLKHLNRSGSWPSGNPRFYYRPKGKKGVPLPDLPQDHPEFLAAYVQAAGLSEAPSAAPRTGSIAAGIVAYLKSDAFAGLSAGTRALRRRHLDDMSGRYGGGARKDLEAKHIRADLEGRSAHAANTRLKAWRGLCGWWSDAGLIDENPAAAVKRRKTNATEGHIPWDRDDLEAFRRHWSCETPQRLAFELIFWTGARMSDAVRLGPGMVDGQGWLSYRQAKTGGAVEIPMTAPAADWAEPESRHHLFAAIDAQASRHAVWMVTAFGSPRSVKAASAWFSAAARAAGISGKSAHGLRKTRAQIMAENGATPDQRAAWLGHESLSEVIHYSRRAERRRMLSGTEPEQESSNSPPPVPSIGGKPLN